MAADNWTQAGVRQTWGDARDVSPRLWSQETNDCYAQKAEEREEQACV